MNQCLQCGENITEYRPNKQYCSNDCKQKAYRYGNVNKNLETLNYNSLIPATNPNKFTPEFVNEIVLETMSEMNTYFSKYDAACIELFVYCKVKLNIRG